ncbi:MAG: ATP-binding protein [Anaerolineae bacterium]
MPPPDIEQLVANPAQTVFVTPQSSRQTIARALVSLANNGGGAVIIGLTPTGKPRRFPNPQAAPDAIMEAALACDPPLIIPTPTLQTYKDRPVLVAVVPPDLPHVYNIDGHYLIWTAGKTAPLQGAALRQLIFARGKAGFDGQAVLEAGRDDLNWDAANAYAGAVPGLKHLSPTEALLKRGCLKIVSGELCPTHAGLLLFGADPQKWLPQAQITVARYTGLQMTDAFIRADIQGTLPEQARQVEAFVLENIGRGVRLDALQRSDDYLYPVTAVREVIVNGLAHRDYSIKGDHIRLLLFANRLECYSPGRLPGHITVDNILQERFSRNATLVQVLFDMGFIERLGYGIDRIVRSLAELGMPQPEFTETAAGFQITLYSRPEPAQAQHPASVRQWLELGLNERQIAALTFVAQGGRISNADYQTLCPNVSPETLRRDLANLVKRDLLLRIGEKRATFYILK